MCMHGEKIFFLRLYNQSYIYVHSLKRKIIESVQFILRKERKHLFLHVKKEQQKKKKKKKRITMQTRSF